MSSEGSYYRYKEIDGLYEWAYSKAGSTMSSKGKLDGYIRLSTGEEWKCAMAAFLPISDNNPDQIAGLLVFTESGEMDGLGILFYVLDGSIDIGIGPFVDGIVETTTTSLPDDISSKDWEVYLEVHE